MDSIELDFALERERRYLEENSTEAIKLALGYFEDYLFLAREIKDLEQNYQHLLADNAELTSQLISMYEEIEAKKAVKIPEFLECQRH